MTNIKSGVLRQKIYYPVSGYAKRCHAGNQGNIAMLRAICQTCGAEIVTEDGSQASEFMVDHLRQFHRVTREPAEAEAERLSAGTRGDCRG